jgi:hypothetical protein
MPRKAIDHQKTLIYKLVCNDVNVKDLYVGSTVSFKDRKRTHKSSCNNTTGKIYNNKIYQTIRTTGGWNNWSMVLIESYPCNSRLEATKRERFWLEELNANLNSNVPSRTIKEYYQDNREKINEYQKEMYNPEYYKEYRIANVEQIKKKQKEYREANREKINQKQKEYSEANREKIKEYYQDNRDAIREQQNNYKREKIECPHCQKLIGRSYLKKHIQSQHTEI